MTLLTLGGLVSLAWQLHGRHAACAVSGLLRTRQQYKMADLSNPATVHASSGCEALIADATVIVTVTVAPSPSLGAPRRLESLVVETAASSTFLTDGAKEDSATGPYAERAREDKKMHADKHILCGG